jgi:hypothetical protein
MKPYSLDLRGRIMRTADLERVRAIRRQVRLESGRPDGRCGKVAEALQTELGWAYPRGPSRWTRTSVPPTSRCPGDVLRHIDDALGSVVRYER